MATKVDLTRVPCTFYSTALLARYSFLFRSTAGAMDKLSRTLHRLPPETADSSRPFPFLTEGEA
jgi:hypothetical protein